MPPFRGLRHLAHTPPLIREEVKGGGWCVWWWGMEVKEDHRPDSRPPAATEERSAICGKVATQTPTGRATIHWTCTVPPSSVRQGDGVTTLGAAAAAAAVADGVGTRTTASTNPVSFRTNGQLHVYKDDAIV